MSSMRKDLTYQRTKKAISKLPPKSYAAMHGFKGGVTVKVYVGKDRELYMLPKDFLCRYSDYFRGLFEGGFAEAGQLTSSLEDIEVEVFQLVLKWIGTGEVVLEGEEQDDSPDLLAADHLVLHERPDEVHAELKLLTQIHLCIDFLIAADFLILIPDPASAVLEKIKGFLKDIWFRNAVTGEMVTKVWQLPSTHPALEFFAKACVADYLQSRFDPTYSMPFRCEKQLHSIPDFSTQLLGVVADLMTDPISSFATVNGRKEVVKVRVRHPLHGYLITVKSPEWSQEGVVYRAEA